LPSFAYTPASLALAGGTFNPAPVRFGFDAGLLRLTGGALAAGPSLSSGIADEIAAVLDNLFASESIVDAQGRPTRRFQEIWANAIGGIKDVLTFQGAAITDLQAIYAGINTAQATATDAVQQAQITEARAALTDSYTDPVDVLTASSDGTVAIRAHDRVYGDGARVSINAGSVSGFSANDYVSVYYEDPARVGGAVAYIGTTNAVAQTGNRHVVGQASIPAVGEPPATGSGVTAPGYTVRTGAPPAGQYEF
jgi:hypothetical protein